jgi:hypothetical protein
MTDMVIKIMIELISVLALATKQISQRRFGMSVLAYNNHPYDFVPMAEKLAKKFLGEKDIESVLARLHRLTEEESRTTVAETLDVVYGLVNNMQVVMEGAHSQFL